MNITGMKTLSIVFEGDVKDKDKALQIVQQYNTVQECTTKQVNTVVSRLF